MHPHLICVTTRVSVTADTVRALAFQALQGPALPSAFNPATLEQHTELDAAGLSVCTTFTAALPT